MILLYPSLDHGATDQIAPYVDRRPAHVQGSVDRKQNSEANRRQTHGLKHN